MSTARRTKGWGMKRIAAMALEVFLILLAAGLFLATIWPAIHSARQD